MNSLRILIVDDQPINLKLLRAKLEAEGHTVIQAANGAEALASLDSAEIDVIVSDILMPVMDGYRLCQEVRRTDRFRDIPFIAYTATYLSPSDEKLTLDLGADKYLRKPASTEELAAAIQEACSNARRPPAAKLDEADALEQYSRRLVMKLEQKNIELMGALEQGRLQATALDTAADAILITDVDGVIQWVNHAFTTTTGYGAEEAIGKTPRILKSGMHDRAFYREFWSTIRSGRPWRGEFTNRRKDGRIYYGEHTVTPVCDSTGSLTHFVGIMHDITARKRAEEQLREAHEQLRDLLEHSPAVIYALTVDGDTVVPRLASDSVTRLLGFEVSETLSFDWWQGQVHPADLPRAEASIAETLNEGVSRSEYRLRHKNGTYRWVEDNRRLVRDAAGGPAEMVGVWTDITERKQAQEELHESERRLREMLDNLQLVSVMLDRNGRITYCNDYFLHLTGWPREDALGSDWFERFVPPDQVEQLRELFGSLLADHSQIRHHSNEILTRAGERRLLRWNNSVLRSASGEVIGTASVAEDITDRKKLEEQFLRAQRMESIGTLAGGIAHDLNNLFMPILMGVSLLRRSPALDEKSNRALANIELSVKRGTDLVKQVLLFARGSEVSHRPTNVNEIVAEVQAIVQSTFPKTITFATTMPKTLRSVVGDPTHLHQVLLNLCVNARDAMPAGGQILISASNMEIDSQYAAMRGGASAGSYVVIEVADDGSGMSKEILTRIFDPFFTTKEVTKGTGLGLSTVRGIVRDYGGFIEVSSEVGKGTAFRVYLPAYTGIETGDAHEGGEGEQFPPGNGELILVVDDEASILAITKDTLESFGYSVMTAEDGAQAIGMFARETSVAAVLTDMMMPVMDGSALIAALQQINASVPVIAMSGHGEGNQMARATQAGAVHFLSKPYSAKVLLRTLSRALRGDEMPQG